MSILKNLFSSGISDIVKSVGDIADEFSLSKEEKQEFKMQMESKMMQFEQELQETYRTELESRAEIIKTELSQGDKFTKRARPTIIYSGLLFIFIVHVIVPIISGLNGGEIMEITLPNEFWWAWGTVVSVYGAGRSAEKFGAANKLTNLITGSGAYKASKNIVG
jgi:hypothetical protein